jgi:hypothetical protein
VASDTGRGKLAREEFVGVDAIRDMVVTDDEGTSIGVPINTILSVIKRDAPDAFAQWIDANLPDRYEAGYSDGYREGYSDSYEMR